MSSSSCLEHSKQNEMPETKSNFIITCVINKKKTTKFFNYYIFFTATEWFV